MRLESTRTVRRRVTSNDLGFTRILSSKCIEEGKSNETICPKVFFKKHMESDGEVDGD